jgi:hypothetical protein
MQPATPASPSSAEAADLLVAQTAKRIADVINDFTREEDERDGTWANTHGKLELALKSQTFVLTIVSNKNGEKHLITVQTKFTRHDANHSNVTSHAFVCTPTRCELDVDFEIYLISQKKRNFDVDATSPGSYGLLTTTTRTLCPRSSRKISTIC